MITEIRDFLFEPRVALILFIVFMTGYLVLLDKENTFKGQFLNYGPSKNTKFLNMTIDTWEKIYIVYFLAFY